MANTEGLTDEVVSSMLAMPSPEEDRQQRVAGGVQTKQKSQGFPLRAMSRREQMMELGEGETPAATVIRSSKAPKIYPSSATKRRTGKAVDSDVIPFEQIISDEEAKLSDQHEIEAISDDRTNNNTHQNHKPVMSSDFIRERPIGTSAGGDSDNKQSTSTTTSKPRESRFKQRNRMKNNGNNVFGGEPTAGGFPSLDAAPVGTFTRKGRSSARVRQSPSSIVSNTGGNSNISNIIMPASNTHTKTKNEENDVGMTSDAMLANMSLEDIREGVEEAKSILSAESIAFLTKRAQQKLAKSKETKTVPREAQTLSLNTDTVTLSKNEAFEQEEKKAKEEKEKMAELLSSVRSPEDMDRVYNEALQLGLAAELPSSSLVDGEEECMSGRMKNLHIASSLLRSTAPRQRLLGARSLCDILEEDVNEMAERRRAHSYSDSCDDRGSMQKKYPQFMPVAIRCLLDESIATYQTAGGRLLLSIVLRCIHALMTLCVHPYHVVNVSPATTTGCDDDPFILHQTCFMSDVSHVPPGTELYPPTQIKPIDNATNAACYRADSSAATAESDSKEFYNDPAWTLLSRMRILPCLSDVMTCLSTHSAGVTISDTTIQSICGILAMLAVRSPGAAGAIARHKGILPFLVSYCLSPSNGITYNDNSPGFFNTGAALPVLILLCHLARQSRDIAKLEMPFQTIMPDLQAILCLEAETEDESRIQLWSIILLRILMRYGIAAEHVQSIIRILAPRAELMSMRGLGAHYLMLFATISDASKTNQQNGQNMPTISEEADECLAMTGVWLSSSVRYCITSFQTVLDGCDNNHMKLATARLRFLASYISTAIPTMSASSIPIVSQEACFEVIEHVLGSDMIDRALTTALATSFNAYWVNTSRSNLLATEESASCAFVTSFMIFVKVVGVSNLGELLKAKLFKKIRSILSQFRSVDLLSPISMMQECSNVHPARQSWYIESEFSVLQIVFEESERLRDDTFRNLAAELSCSLVGRLDIGHEAIAAFIFRQEALFKVKDDETDQLEPLLQKLFLLELSSNADRQLQLNHSSNLMNDSDGALSSLRCAADFVGGSDGERFFLPLGPLWLWNVLSSTITSQSSALPNDDQSRVSDIVSNTLLILLQLENTSINSRYSNSINDGTKLYHITNVCLFPEKTLSSVESILTLLFKQFNTSALASDYIKACFEHSRLSRESKQTSSRDKGIGSTEEALQSLFTTGGEQSLSTGEYSKDELRALDDFVDDLCNAYIEYGGQYAIFTYFIRLFFRHDFPSKVTTSVLTKLLPILNVLTVEEEDSSALHSSLSQSISGGLPSSDSSRRDPSSLLDLFSSALKEINNKELLRNDYMYLLAVAILSRNLVSSSQRCECGLAAMKQRLSKVSDSVFYDIAQVSEKILRSGDCTKTVLVTCVLDLCTDNNCGLLAQDIDTQNKWQWNSDRDAVWNQVVAALHANM